MSDVMGSRFPKLPALALTLSLQLLGGCASTIGYEQGDPLERYNRAIYSFNEGVDRAVFKPLAKGYETVTPMPVRSGIGNFFGNLADLWIGFNNLLQGKAADALSDLGRVMVNSVFGVLGVFDLASGAGLEKHDEDFGQTLGRWGVGPGPYVVLPVLGPRTLRDAFATPVDYMADPVSQLGDVATRNSVSGLRLVHNRAALLGVEKTLQEGTLDSYIYARDYYLQQRRYRVYDGRPPRESFDD
jgi:phospholipid-binding lipoprotein MlaA